MMLAVAQNDRSPLRSVLIDMGHLPPAFGSMSTSRKTARPYSGTPESFGLEGIVRKRERRNGIGGRRRQEELPHKRLLSDFFLVWKRFLARPVVSIAIKSKSDCYLRCKNGTKCDVMIKKIRTIPKTVFVARDHSITAVTDGLIGIPFTAQIPPNATYDFPLIVRRGELLDDDAPRSRFMIIVSWRSTGSTWLPRWPIFIWSSMQTLHASEP